MKRSGKQVVGTDNEIQSLDSKACGYYCVFYLKQRAMGVPTYDILYQFTMDPEKNDKILREFFKDKQKMTPIRVYDLHGNLLSGKDCSHHEIQEAKEMIHRIHDPSLKRNFNEVVIKVGDGIGKKIRYPIHLPVNY